MTRQGRQALSAFFIGAVLSSLLLGVVLGVFGLVTLLSDAAVWLLRLAIVVFVAVRVFSLDLQAPTSRWVVPRHWRAVGWIRWSFLFGFLLGPGFLTAVPTGTYYIVVLAAVALGDPAAAACVMAAFGAARCLPMLAVSRCVRTPPMISRSQSTVACLARMRPYRRRLAAAQPAAAAMLLGVMS